MYPQIFFLRKMNVKALETTFQQLRTTFWGCVRFLKYDWFKKTSLQIESADLYRLFLLRHQKTNPCINPFSWFSEIRIQIMSSSRQTQRKKKNLNTNVKLTPEKRLEVSMIRQVDQVLKSLENKLFYRDYKMPVIIVKLKNSLNDKHYTRQDIGQLWDKIR